MSQVQNEERNKAENGKEAMKKKRKQRKK